MTLLEDVPSVAEESAGLFAKSLGRRAQQDAGFFAV